MTVQSSGGADTAGAPGVGVQAVRLIGRVWAWLFLLALIAFFTATAPHFFDLFNFQAMGANTAIVLVLALGQTFVIITGGIDLSVGYVMGLATVVISLIMQNMVGYPLPVALLAGMAGGLGVGITAGLFNGFVVARLNVSPFIATLGTLGIAQGLAFVLSGGPPVSIQIPGLGALGNGYVVYWHSTFGLGLFGLPEGVTGPEMRNVRSFIPLQLLYAGVLTATCAYLLSSTQFGRHVYAIGGSAKAALRAGIPVKRDLFKVYVLSSVMASLAGLMYVLRYTGGVASSGDALLLSSIAAIVIGGASLFGGEGRIGGTLVGAMIIAVIQNGLVLLGIDPFWQYAAVGAVIILAVLADQAKLRIVR
ncbi:MAG: ABC transporter permease [Bauldia sp.]|uniref:ABC transporter permease n=1 Tax=Bauldia sp. TaxID=2575872 RepID=UPI001DA771F4|nr:ABC transporter permease [Bauldia sp.]MCB1497355.1 ABC transporter permease [Bauldia sp.]